MLLGLSSCMLAWYHSYTGSLQLPLDVWWCSLIIGRFSMFLWRGHPCKLNGGSAFVAWRSVWRQFYAVGRVCSFFIKCGWPSKPRFDQGAWFLAAFPMCGTAMPFGEVHVEKQHRLKQTGVTMFVGHAFPHMRWWFQSHTHEMFRCFENHSICDFTFVRQIREKGCDRFQFCVNDSIDVCTFRFHANYSLDVSRRMRCDIRIYIYMYTLLICYVYPYVALAFPVSCFGTRSFYKLAFRLV